MRLIIVLCFPLLACSQPIIDSVLWSFDYFSDGVELRYGDHCVTATGESFVCGTSYDTQLGFRGFLQKLGADGEQLWLRFYGTGIITDQLSLEAVELVSDGSVAIGGTRNNYQANWSRLYAAQIDPQSGDLMWSYQTTDSLVSRGQVVASPAGGYYVTGLILVSAIGEERLYVARLDAQGGEQWAETYGEMTASLPYFARAYADGLVVAGTVIFQRPSPRLVAHLISSDATEIFDVEYSDEGERAVGLRVFDDGLLAVLVADGSDVPAELYLNELNIINDEGVIERAFRLPLKTFSDDGSLENLYEFVSLELLDQVTIAISGGKYVSDPSPPLRIRPMMAVFDLSTSDTLGVLTYGDTLSGQPILLPSLERAHDGGVVLVSSEYGPNFSIGLTAARIGSEVSAVDDGIVEDFTLFDVYPNPFNSQTQIRFFLERPAQVELAVYDITGRRILSMADQTFTQGQHSLTLTTDGLATGVYFARLTNNDQQLTRKLLLLR